MKKARKDIFLASLQTKWLCVRIPFLSLKLVPVLSKEFLDIEATTECKFTLKRVRDMIITYRQIYRTDKYSQYNNLSSLAKWSSVRLGTKWLWVRIPLLSINHLT